MTQPNTVSPRTYVPQDRLYVWAMVNPVAPTLVGEVGLSQLVSDCATFTYAPEWWHFALSEDMPLIQGQTFTTGQKNTAPGAIDDARPYRVHCLSANTALRAAGLEQSYSNLATILLRLGHPDRQAAMREELFKRMVFNILMDNTDDHERNHSISLNLADGYYDLTPAYDIVPSLQNLGYQQLIVGTMGAESSIENALTQINEYGIKKPRAVELVRQVASVVDRWAAHFIALGVSASDMELLAASIDRDALRLQRKAYL